MVQEPELAVLGSFMRVMDKAGNIIRLREYPLSPKETAHHVERDCPVTHPAVIMRRDTVLKAGGYRKAFCHAEDYDLWLRISDLGCAIDNLPQPLLKESLVQSEISCGTGMCRQNRRPQSLILKQGENRIFTLRALMNPGWIHSEIPYPS